MGTKKEEQELHIMQKKMISRLWLKILNWNLHEIGQEETDIEAKRKLSTKKGTEGIGIFIGLGTSVTFSTWKNGCGRESVFE